MAEPVLPFSSRLAAALTVRPLNSGPQLVKSRIAATRAWVKSSVEAGNIRKTSYYKERYIMVSFCEADGTMVIYAYHDVLGHVVLQLLYDNYGGRVSRICCCIASKCHCGDPPPQESFWASGMGTQQG